MHFQNLFHTQTQVIFEEFYKITSASLPQGCFLCFHHLPLWLHVSGTETLAGCVPVQMPFLSSTFSFSHALPSSELCAIFLCLFQIWVSGFFYSPIRAQLLGLIIRNLSRSVSAQLVKGYEANSQFKKLAKKVQSQFSGDHTSHSLELQTNRKLLQMGELFEISWLLNSASGDLLFLWFK